MPEFKNDRSKFKMKSWETFVNNPNETPFKFGLGKLLKKGAKAIGGAARGAMGMSGVGMIAKAMKGGGGPGGAASQAMARATGHAMGQPANELGPQDPNMAGAGMMAAGKLARMAKAGGMGSAMLKKSKKKNKY